MKIQDRSEFKLSNYSSRNFQVNLTKSFVLTTLAPLQRHAVVLTFPPFISGSELTKSDTLGDITLLIVSSSGQTAASTGGMDIDLQLSHHRSITYPYSHTSFSDVMVRSREEDLSRTKRWLRLTASPVGPIYVKIVKKQTNNY